jgi:hypothetical protein
MPCRCNKKSGRGSRIPALSVDYTTNDASELASVIFTAKYVLMIAGSKVLVHPSERRLVSYQGIQEILAQDGNALYFENADEQSIFIERYPEMAPYL